MLEAAISASAGTHNAFWCAKADISTTTSADRPAALGATDKNATNGVGAP